MPITKSPEAGVTAELIEAIRSFPATQRVEHCGQSSTISAFETYFKCVECGTRIKVRSFAGIPEVEDVFDAVFEWMSRPENAELAMQRLEVVAADAVDA